MKTHDDLVANYLINTALYNEIRTKITCDLSLKQIKDVNSAIMQIVQGNNYLAKYHANEKITLETKEPLIVIVIYGQITHEGRLYHKGTHLTLGDPTPIQPPQIIFSKPTTLIFLKLQIFTERLQTCALQKIKLDFIETCFPIKQLKLSSLQIKKISKILDVKIIHQKYHKIDQISGIFLLFQGVFQLCCRGVPFLQIQKNFIEISQALEHSIQLKSCEGKYGYINRELFYEIVTQQSAHQMEKIWKSKQELREKNKAKRQYNERTIENMKKIAVKLRQTKKRNGKYMISLNLAKKHSLQSFLSKTQPQSSVLFTARKSSRITLRTTTHLKHLSQTQHVEPQTWRSTMQTKGALQLDRSQQRLNRMRYFNKQRKKTALKLDWFTISSPTQKKQIVKNTYWRVNKFENLTQVKKAFGQRTSKILSTHSQNLGSKQKISKD